MPDVYVAPKIKKTRKSVADKLKKERSYHHLAAMLIRPLGIHFETQEKKEKIILLLRRHPITNLPWVLMALLMLFVPVVLPQMVPLVLLPGRFRFILALSWYLLTFSFAFERFLSWFFNVNIITDERIVDIDFISLFDREISDAKLERIQDKTVEMGGLFPTLFNYGNLRIQTAGERPELEFEKIPQPDRVVDILNELIAEEEQEKIEGRVR